MGAPVQGHALWGWPNGPVARNAGCSPLGLYFCTAGLHGGVLLCLGTTLTAWFGYGVLETLPFASPLMWLAVFPLHWLEAVAWGGAQARALHWAAALPGAAGWGLKLAAMASVARGLRFQIPSRHSSSPRHSLVFFLDLCMRDEFVATETAHKETTSPISELPFLFVGLHMLFAAGAPSFSPFSLKKNQI